jgi:hypothetical protein
MPDRQTIIDLYDQYARRVPSETEIAQYLETSAYQVTAALRRYDSGYNATPEWGTRYTQLQALSLQIFGDYSDPQQLDHFIRQELSDDQVMFGWRSTARYQQMYAGKPPQMSESKYRELKDTYELEGPTTRNMFKHFLGLDVTDQDMQKIYYGGEGSADIRREYARVRALQASEDSRFKQPQINTQVELSPFGPTTPMMRGLEAGPTDLPPLPPPGQIESDANARWLSFRDYVAQRENPRYQGQRTRTPAP